MLAFVASRVAVSNMEDCLRLTKIAPRDISEHHYRLPDIRAAQGRDLASVYRLQVVEQHD